MGGVNFFGAAAVVGDDSGGSEVDADARAEKLDTQKRGGEWRFRGLCENGTEAECCEKIDRRTESEGVSEGSPDEEKRGDFAAIEVGAVGDNT